jgi:uncharacterized Zn finger protein
MNTFIGREAKNASPAPEPEPIHAVSVVDGKDKGCNYVVECSECGLVANVASTNPKFAANRAAEHICEFLPVKSPRD